VVPAVEPRGQQTQCDPGADGVEGCFTAAFPVRMKEDVRASDGARERMRVAASAVACVRGLAALKRFVLNQQERFK